MNEREQLTIVLLRTLDQYIPGPRTASGILRQAAALGPAAGDRTRCKRCRATGSVGGHGVKAKPCGTCVVRRQRCETDKHTFRRSQDHGCKPCDLCDGTGWRTLQPAFYDDDGNLRAEGPAYFAGEQGEDEYLRPGRTELVDQAHRRAEERRRVDALLARIAADEKIRAGIEAAGDVHTAADDARSRLWAAGDYRPLCVNLERLQQQHLGWCRAVVVTYVDQGGVREIGPILQTAADLGVSWVAAEMPDDIRVPPWLRPELVNGAAKASLWRGRQEAHSEARGERNARIRAMAGSGLSAGAIARRPDVPLSRRRVQQILLDGIQAAASASA